MISDAGTPVIMDPGYRLVNAAHEGGIAVQPIPGPCALIAALCASGMPSDQFFFTGFLPSAAVAKSKMIEHMKSVRYTWIFYESPHRILDTVMQLERILGKDRKIVLAREITKYFEGMIRGTIENVNAFLNTNKEQCRGEFVILVHGNRDISLSLTQENERMLRILLQTMPLKQASTLAAKITGSKKRDFYDYGLTLS